MVTNILVRKKKSISAGESVSQGLADNLQELGFEKETIDFSLLEAQHEVSWFSFDPDFHIEGEQMCCYLTRTIESSLAASQQKNAPLEKPKKKNFNSVDGVAENLHVKPYTQVVKLTHGKFLAELSLNNIAELLPLYYSAIRQQLQSGKTETDLVFHDLNTKIILDHLDELATGLTPKVFKIHNASMTLDAKVFNTSLVAKFAWAMDVEHNSSWMQNMNSSSDQCLMSCL
ncbi:unnamed protein product [Brassica oleracea]